LTLRGSFNRLYGLVIEHLKGDPLADGTESIHSIA
jgi:hypothetical protein